VLAVFLRDFISDIRFKYSANRSSLIGIIGWVGSLKTSIRAGEILPCLSSK